MIDDPTPPIEEVEVVSESNNPTTAPPATSSQVTPPPFDINAYNATLETVRRRLVILEKAREELKKAKEMYDDIFINDPLYQEADKEVKEISKKKKEVQARIARQPNVASLNAKIKEVKDHIKDNEEVLSQELIEYYRTAGVTEIEDAEGNVQEFAIFVRLKPKRRTE